MWTGVDASQLSSNPDMFNLSTLFELEQRTLEAYKRNEIRIGICSALLAIGAYGNIRSIAQLFKRRCVITRATWRRSALRISLLVADCMIIFVFLPSELAWIHFDQWYAGEVGCRVVMGLRAVGFYAMSASVAAIAVDRMLYAQSAVQYHIWQGRILLTTCLVWLASLSLSLPNLFFYTVRGGQCEHIYAHGTLQTVAVPLVYDELSLPFLDSTEAPASPSSDVMESSSALKATTEAYPLLSILFMFWLPFGVMVIAYGTICRLVSTSVTTQYSIDPVHSHFSSRKRSPRARYEDKCYFVFCCCSCSGCRSA